MKAKPSKFKNEARNLEEFLESVAKYFRVEGIQDTNKRNILNIALGGHAKNWYATSRSNFDVYDAFKAAIVQEFYSIPIQVKIKAVWLAKQFDPCKETSRLTFWNKSKDHDILLPHWTLMNNITILYNKCRFASMIH